MNELGLALLAQANDGAGTGVGIVGIVIYLALIVAIVAGLWMTFQKAGQPGWAAIVPIYNLIVLIQISGKPLWWVVIWIIPCTSIIAQIYIPIELAKSFGKGVGFGLGLAFLPFIFCPILGFGDARYQGARAV